LSEKEIPAKKICEGLSVRERTRIVCLGNRSCGLKTLLTCAEFDESTPASAKSPRMQVVMGRI
jgi:hypothetical protein